MPWLLSSLAVLFTTGITTQVGIMAGITSTTNITGTGGKDEMEAEQVFKLAAAAVALAEIVEDYFDGEAGLHEVEDYLEEYQHIRDRG